MDLKRENLLNLHALWQIYGAIPLPGSNDWWRHPHWPNRCWAQGESPAQLVNSFAQLPRDCVLPVFEDTAGVKDEGLRSAGWQVAFEQVAMVRPLEPVKSDDVSVNNANEGFHTVRTESQLQDWRAIQGAAFGYDIDAAAIHSLLSESDAKVWLYREHNKTLAGVILLKTGGIVGVHQLAVNPEYQGRGIARRLMQRVLTEAALWGGDYLVLQASAAGLPLYQSLGFEEQFRIRNYAYIG